MRQISIIGSILNYRQDPVLRKLHGKLTEGDPGVYSPGKL